MKKLTLEKYVEIVTDERWCSHYIEYHELLPYLKDEEEERHIPKVYVVIETTNKRILGCFESEVDAYRYADVSPSSNVKELLVEPSKQRSKEETVNKGETGDRIHRQLDLGSTTLIETKSVHQHEPSRLMISAMCLNGLLANNRGRYQTLAEEAIGYADELIKQANQ